MGQDPRLRKSSQQILTLCLSYGNSSMQEHVLYASLMVMQKLTESMTDSMKSGIAFVNVGLL